MDNFKLSFSSNKRKQQVWLMRQAGRYLPEYRFIRKLTSNFLELCYSPEKAADITLQPIKRFDLDAAIIFSDILVLPNALGVEIEFREQIGPVIQSIKEQDLIEKLSSDVKNNKKLSAVYEAIKIVKNQLQESKSLIGFAGGPWTVASYLIEGRGRTNFQNIKILSYTNEKFITELIDLITKKTILHLHNQILSGVDVIQIFESHAGNLSEAEFYKYIIFPTTKIVRELKNMHPDIKIIGFPRGSGSLYHDYSKITKIDGVSCDQFLPIREMIKLENDLLVQGNIDPLILLTNKDLIKRKVEQLLSIFHDKKFILNLGHGILPSTPIENVEFLVNAVHNYGQ